MKPTLAYPAVLIATLAATVFSVQAAAETRPDCARQPASATAAAEPMVADDPTQPLDPRDPQFAQKSAQRYRALDTRRAELALAQAPAQPAATEATR